MRAWLRGGGAGLLPLTLWLACSALGAEPAPRPILGRDAAIPAVQFAASEIQRALAARAGVAVEFPLEAALNSSQTQATRILLSSGAEENRRLTAALGLAPLRSTNAQAYAIRVQRDAGRLTVAVLGADAAGAMYGGLDVGEALRLGAFDTLTNSDHSPFIARRGLKFNIPLDLRTPSYSDNSDAAQQNIPEMWSLDFWRDFLDEMARNRFNVLTLWNLHPFPSLVKVPGFPDVALADVWRTRKKMDETYSLSGSDMLRPALLQDVEVVKTLSIDQKIEFWRQVMQLAHDRGIEVYWFTWNIFTFGTDGKDGITRSQTNPRTIEYFRDSVRELVLTYFVHTDSALNPTIEQVGQATVPISVEEGVSGLIVNLDKIFNDATILKVTKIKPTDRGTFLLQYSRIVLDESSYTGKGLRDKASHSL